MDGGNEPQRARDGTAGDVGPARTVPTRPDGWPDWLGRRPMTSVDQKKIREVLDAGLPASALTAPGPFLCYLTIDGLGREPDPAKAIRLRGRIHAAARAVAEHRQTSYHATDATVTIGIRGPDAQEKVNRLRTALAPLAAEHGWTTREEPR